MKSFRTDREKFGWLKGFAACAVAVGVFWMTAFTALAAEGEITAETAYIRSQANTESEVVGSTAKGKKVDLIESVKDSAGVTWYKVPVAGGGYGYIRGDLVKTSDTVPAASTTSQTTDQPAANQPAETVPTSIGEQPAVIKCESNAKIRSGASTSHSVVTSLPNGTSITLIGEANDNAGNKWYQITSNYNGRNIEGYIRSDLIAIGAQGGDNSSEGEGGGEAPAEGENPEGGEGENPEGEGQAPEEYSQEPAPEESHSDYDVVWENEEYYLYDYPAKGKTKISLIKEAIDYVNVQAPKMEKTIKTNKIIIFALAGVIVILFIIMTILIFKIRSLYYEDYDEDEEDEEEEEEEPEPVLVKKKVIRRKVEEEAEEPVPVRKKKPVPKDETAGRSSERPARPKREAEPEMRAAERKEGTKRPAARKSQNFLVDDDEFEFEFLNMDDKDV
ncbi:MAG: SH3 domain-containing protein [Lachnospiraceae bacterium]|nr:SH3 domain-containing protein [Lachnospiraceae bacterium]